MIKNLLAVQMTWVQFLGWEDSPGEGNGYPLQYSCLENTMGGRAWQAGDHGAAKSLNTTDLGKLNMKCTNGKSLEKSYW